MILLIAAPGAARKALVSSLAHERLSTKVCDAFGPALGIYLEVPHFDVIVAECAGGDGGARAFIDQLFRRGFRAPVIVIGAPGHAEVELYQAGAASVLGSAYWPRSLALQCANLKRLAAARGGAARRASPAPRAEFVFGTARVVPENRLLVGEGKGSRPAPVASLTGLQIALLETLHASPGKILSHQFLSHAVWHRAYRGRSGAIREAVSALRAKFNSVGLDLDRWVESVYGAGFRYRPQ